MSFFWYCTVAQGFLLTYCVAGCVSEQVNTAVLELQTVVQAWTDIPNQWGAGLRKTACHSSLHPRGQNRMVIENRALHEELQFTLCSKQPLSWNLEVECDCMQPVVHPTVAHHTSNAWRSPRTPQCVTNSSRKRLTTQIPCPWATGTESMQTQVAKHLEYSCMSIHQPLKLEKKIGYLYCCIASFLPSSMRKKLAIWSYLAWGLNLLNKFRPLGSRPQRTRCVDGHVPRVGHQSVAVAAFFPLMKLNVSPTHTMEPLHFHGLFILASANLRKSSKSRTSWVEKVSSKANLGNPPDLVAIKWAVVKYWLSKDFYYNPDINLLKRLIAIIIPMKTKARIVLAK